MEVEDYKKLVLILQEQIKAYESLTNILRIQIEDLRQTIILKDNLINQMISL